MCIPRRSICISMLFRVFDVESNYYRSYTWKPEGSFAECINVSDGETHERFQLLLFSTCCILRGEICPSFGDLRLYLMKLQLVFITFHGSRDVLPGMSRVCGQSTETSNLETACVPVLFTYKSMHRYCLSRENCL
jgi:hypothetical protein